MCNHINMQTHAYHPF